MAKYAYENLEAKTAAVIQDVAQDYSVGLSFYFREKFIELTGDPMTVVAFTSYQTGDQDFTAQLTWTKGKKPDVLFVPGYFGDLALIAKQAKELGIEARILAADAAQAPELIEIGGRDVEGLVFSNHYTPEQSIDEAGKEFVRLYTERHAKTPNAFAALGYDTYNMLLDVIEAAGEADLFLSVGTSAVVYPAAGLIEWAISAGAKTIEVNLEPTPVTRRVDAALHGKAGEVLPQLVGTPNRR